MSYNDPKSWGPHFWFVMRCIAANYPDNPTNDDKYRIIKFYRSLKYLLPCEKCQHHYREILRNYPIERNVKNKNELTRWVEKIYKKINENK